MPAGDVPLTIFLWKILRVNSGTVRVEDAHGQPPGIPFWLGEAPGRTAEVSDAVSRLRVDIQKKIEEAISEYQKAIELRPQLPEAHFNLALALVAQGRLDEALAAGRTAPTDWARPR